ncbi:MAG TPA: alpha/beta fold hydrolase [Gemmatimonadaceae bacterium]|nr:alpha/beta fold hydrolase [Gemmatimonadaceae bacterium]
MNWRRLLMSGGAAVGGVAAYNLLARRSVAPLTNLIGGEEGWAEWRGHRLAYTVRGAGPPVLLLHSVGYWSWSYEWRHNVDVLARDFTVYTLDLLGFGRSDRPAVAYGARLYLSLIADFARRVIRAPAALVGAGLSGVYAAQLAAADPAHFPMLVLVAPTGLTTLRERASAADAANRRLVGTPVLGTAAWNAHVSRSSLLRMLEVTYYRDDSVSDEMLATAFATTHQPGAKHAPTAWLAHQLALDVRPALRRLLQPSLLVWGAQAEENPAEESFGYRALKRDLRVAILDPAGDLPHDERPEEFNEVVGEFLRV